MKLGNREAVDRAVESADFRPVRKKASLTAKNFRKENKKLLEHISQDFTLIRGRPICDDPLFDPARPLCEAECTTDFIGDHHPNCSLYCLSGYSELDRCKCIDTDS